MHRVVNRQARGHDAARRIDVKRDFLLRIVGLEKQQLRDDQRGRDVVDRPDHEDDALTQQAGENVERAFAASRLLDDDRHQIVGIVVDQVAHGSRFQGIKLVAELQHNGAA